MEEIAHIRDSFHTMVLNMSANKLTIMIKGLFKSYGVHLVSVLIILAAALIQMGPQLQDKTISGGDVVSSYAWSKQVTDYKKETGDQSYWNPSMFSGMPWGLLTAGVKYNYSRFVDNLLFMGFGPALGIVIKLGLITYIALILLGVPWYIALLAVVSLIFNVNYSVLLEAGHQSKVKVITNFPLIIAGLTLVFQKRWLAGAAAIAVATSLAIANNHIQMVYYLLLCLVVYALSFLVQSILNKETKALPKIIGVALIAAAIGGLANFSLLTSAKAFSDDTMRGKPILKTIDPSTTQSSSAKDGLAWEYAMQWSNDWKEVTTMIIPRFVGGSTYEEVPANSKTGKLLRQNGAKKGSDNTYQAPMYWGTLTFTSGPNYIGILFIFLSIFSLFFVPNYKKWGFSGAIFLTILLSLGNNASWLNKFLFDYFPLFDKFRAPNSIMNLIPVFMAMLGTLGLTNSLKLEDRSKLYKPLLFAGGITVGFCLIFAVLGSSLFSFESAGDARYANEIKDIFIADRISLFNQDAWRSTILALLISAVFYGYYKNILKSKYLFIGLLGLIMCCDQLGVVKRHLDQDNWESKRIFTSDFNERPVDKRIIQSEPKGRGYYRVMDIPNMTSAVGSYRHNTIGGYHAAKLQRYQDILDYHINQGNQGVINMLNAKYIIRSPEEAQANVGALGNAWFVTTINDVSSPKEEIESLSSINTATTAVVNKTDFSAFDAAPGDGQGTIELTNYKPNELTYESNSPQPQFAVFSEVWYEQSKGLSAYIDGKKVDFVRVNYILRGLHIPAGSHSVVFAFTPKINGKWISVLASVLLLLLIGYAFYEGFKNKEERTVVTN